MSVPHQAEALAIFVAAGHATDDSGGDVLVCSRCAYVHPVERDVDIPACDGPPGRARRLRAVERTALREWERAERAARQAEREAGVGDPLGYETRVSIEAVTRLMAEDALEGRDREAVDAERARAVKHLSGGWATEDGRSMHALKHIAESFARAESDPVVLVNGGQPRRVLMSVEEFRRLKEATGEPVPSAAMPRTSAVIRKPG